jgi:polyisoprenoid-binding protein YceI
MLGLMKVKGNLALLDGVLQINGDGDATGSMRLDAASIVTGIGKRDTHLRSPDFFHAAEHPHVDFVLHEITVDQQGAHAFSGALEIRGTSVPLSAPLTAEVLGPDRLRLTATAVADHQAAGLGWAKAGMIRGQIPLHAELTLVRDRG